MATSIGLEDLIQKGPDRGGVTADMLRTGPDVGGVTSDMVRSAPMQPGVLSQLLGGGALGSPAVDAAAGAAQGLTIDGIMQLLEQYGPQIEKALPGLIKGGQMIGGGGGGEGNDGPQPYNPSMQYPASAPLQQSQPMPQMRNILQQLPPMPAQRPIQMAPMPRANPYGG